MEIARFGGMLVFAVCPQGDALCQMPIGEVGLCERERHFATFPCGNGDALKTFEFANGARKTPYQVAEVELRHCDCLDIAGGCRSFYSDSFAPRPVHLSGAQGKWLFRCMGETFVRECSAREAFDAYESYRKDDPHALLARYAAEEE